MIPVVFCYSFDVFRVYLTFVDSNKRCTSSKEECFHLRFPLSLLLFYLRCKRIISGSQLNSRSQLVRQMLTFWLIPSIRQCLLQQPLLREDASFIQ